MEFIKKYKYLLFNLKFLRLIYYKLYKSKFKNFNHLVLNTNSIVLDFGANFGEISHYLYDNYKCNIDCYEPNKYAFYILNNFFKNNEKIKCFNIAVSTNDGIAKLYYHKLNLDNPLRYSTASSLLKEKDNLNFENFDEVKTYSIKKIINQFSNIDLIKIDIEGYEYEILPVIFENKKKIKKVVCELHGDPGKIKNNFLNQKYKKLIEKINIIDPKREWFIFHY